MDSPTMMTRMEAAFATSGVSMMSAKSLALMRTKIPQIRRARPTTRKMRLKAKRQYFIHLFPHPLTIFGEWRLVAKNFGQFWVVFLKRRLREVKFEARGDLRDERQRYLVLLFVSKKTRRDFSIFRFVNDNSRKSSTFSLYLAAWLVTRSVVSQLEFRENWRDCSPSQCCRAWVMHLSVCVLFCVRLVVFAIREKQSIVISVSRRRGIRD